MPAYRFQLVEPHIPRLIGISAAVLWLVVVAQLASGPSTYNSDAVILYQGGRHFNWLIYVAAFALGLTLLWQWLGVGTRSFIIVAPEGLSLELSGLTQWLVPWKDFATWDWEHDLFGQPFGLVVHTNGWQNRHFRLGVLYAGSLHRGKIIPNPQYRALLKALSHYVPTKGAAWSRTVPWAQ